MKTNQISLIAVPILALLASCSSSPESVAPDKNEEYTREFVSKFGVPASGHDYSMATSAGLKVTTAKGSHVTVTAFVGDTEYLFADLSVPAGTHAIPVTIPRSVTELYVKSSSGVHAVSPNATVNLDQAPTSKSRGGYYDIQDQTIDGDMILVERNGRDGHPYIAFKPSEFLNDFFNSDKPLVSQKASSSGINYLMHSGETALSGGFSGTDYYIFPIYWRAREKSGNKIKDYRTHMFKVMEGGQNELHSVTKALFRDDDTSENIPFPYLGYTTDEISRADITEDDLIGKAKADNQAPTFKFDDGSFEQAYNPETAKMVVSRGIEIKIKANISNYYQPIVAFGIKSDIKSAESYDLSASSPFYNSYNWGNCYFDVSLDELFLASASTYEMRLNSSASTFINDDMFYGTPDVTEGKFKTKGGSYKSLVGFNSPATQEADKSNRDYSDVILLIVPRQGSETRKCIYSKIKTFSWTIAAEDLGGSLDWDFNDAVFTFTDVIQNLNTVNKNSSQAIVSGPQNTEAVRVITVKPLAAGGTMPIYITYTGESVQTMPTMLTEGTTLYSEAEKQYKETMQAEGQSGTFIIGKELHKWLGGYTHSSAMNVGANRGNHNAKEVSFVIPVGEYPDDYVVKHDPAVSGDNTHLYGFGVLVDKANTLNVDAINDTDHGFKLMDGLTIGQGDYMIGKPNQAKDQIAPQMLLVTGDWEWPQEGINILEAYPTFNNWVTSPSSAQDWNANPTDGKITKK